MSKSSTRYNEFTKQNQNKKSHCYTECNIVKEVIPSQTHYFENGKRKYFCKVLALQYIAKLS